MTEPLILDNTKRSTYRACPKKYFFSVIKGLQSNWGSTALRYGVCIHGMMEGFYTHIKTNGWPVSSNQQMQALTSALELGKQKFDKEGSSKTYNDDYRNFNTAVEAFNAYLEAYKEDSNYVKIINTEKKFECPIEPENEVEEKLLKGLPPVIFTGRIDLCVEMDFQKWIQDFKTTGWAIDQAAGKSNRSPQLIGYSYAGKKVLDFEPSGCLASFIYSNSYKSKKTGEYGEAKFDFRRVPQIYTQRDIDAWKLSFISTCKEIHFSMENDIWSEGFDNCYQYGACTYLKLCNQHASNFDELNTEGFHVEFWDVLEED